MDKCSNNALKNARENGIKEVFVTTWGDNGAEVLQTVNLIGAQIFAENGYADEFDEEKFKKRFAFCTEANADDFKLFETLDKTPDSKGVENEHLVNASKYLMWQDILTGLVDKNIEGVSLGEHYTELATRVKNLRDSHYENWMHDYKATGWDIIDMRYGGLLMRIDSAIRAICAYLDGKIEKIEELEVERLYFHGKKRPLKWSNFYGTIVSVSRIDGRA